MPERRKIKTMYIIEAICDKCGAELRPTGICYCTYPNQHKYICTNIEYTETGICYCTYPYQREYICTNIECAEKYTFSENNLPGVLKYEFEEDEDV